MGVKVITGAGRREKLEAELKRMLPLLEAQGVEKIILIGSMAEGHIGATSDLDLIVIHRTSQRFLDRLDTFYRLLAPRVALDLLVYTPEEFQEMARTSSFVRAAQRRGKVLYEAGSAG
ncbi:MAG: nucleotidyltransferase domain-containing protein [Deltaproteobacteria bacterium]|nr:nucleotidyltransferase domain-containing protein [Deltaproteobacteria bacterium]MBI3077655.1 nucleotidyltransferase domain-containing protein [Deltaproteobacteria bacterium]